MVSEAANCVVVVIGGACAETGVVDACTARSTRSQYGGQARALRTGVCISARAVCSVRFVDDSALWISWVFCYKKQVCENGYGMNRCRDINIETVQLFFSFKDSAVLAVPRHALYTRGNGGQ